MITPEQAENKQGHNVAAFIKEAKDCVGVTSKVRVFFKAHPSQRTSRASADIRTPDGIPVMWIPDLAAIKADTGLNEEEALAKQKTAVFEELCHIKNEKAEHDGTIVTCIRTCLDGKLVTDRERELIKAKMDKMGTMADIHAEAKEATSDTPTLQSTPIAPQPPQANESPEDKKQIETSDIE